MSESSNPQAVDPSENPRQLGVQPVDAVMDEMEVGNHALVEISTEHLTHKMVQKARKGRKITRNIQNKVLNAVNAVRKGRGVELMKMTDLFNYKG